MGTKINKKAQTKASKNKTFWGVVGVLLVLVLAVVGYRQWAYSQQKKTAAPPQVKDNQQSDTTKSSTSSGGVVDNNSTKTSTTTAPPATQTQASSAAITLVAPADSALVTNGSTLSGMASVATVQYRFKDADGLDVATGALNVVSSKYSGSIAGLNARTTTGTLEVYNYNAKGAEENWVKINVRYK